MDSRIRRAKDMALFRSWLIRTLIMLGFFAAACFMAEEGRFENLFTVRYLQLTSLAVVGHSAFWMLFGWIRVVEGEYLHAEYGGVGNRLQRIIFRNRPSWTLTEPLNLPLEFKSRNGCILYVSVWENFLGRNKIMYRMINLYTGENASPWDDEDGRSGHY